MPFKAVIAGDTFKKKIDQDIFNTGFNKQGKEPDETFDKVLWICRQAKLNLNKDECLLICTSIPFFGNVISWEDVSPDPRKVQTLTWIPPPKYKKGAAIISGYVKLPK